NNLPAPGTLLGRKAQLPEERMIERRQLSRSQSRPGLAAQSRKGGRTDAADSSLTRDDLAIEARRNLVDLFHRVGRNRFAAGVDQRSHFRQRVLNALHYWRAVFRHGS